MQATTEQRAWLKNVLGIDLSPVNDQADHHADGEGNLVPPVEGDQNWFTDKLKDLAADVKAVVTGADSRVDTKRSLLAQLAGLTDPAVATDDEKAGFKKERDAIAAALALDAPPDASLKDAAAAIGRLRKLIDLVGRRKTLAALDSKNPEAAKQARAAFDKFDRVLGDTEVTPELVKQTSADRATKEKDLASALAVLKNAKKLPDTEPRKAAAIKKAEANYNAAKAAADQAVERENAMVGRDSLTKAISHGPLSAESDAPFKDPATAQKLIAAYSQDARMADAAVTAASGSKFPEAIADNVGPMITRAQGGFAAGSGESFSNRDTATKYGTDLLKMGGNVGPEYFARLPDYVASGQQFVDNATGDAGASTFTDLAQKRSVKLAGALIKPDGSVDTTSDGAKAAIGNQLFHPDAMRNQTPAMSAHVLKTVDFLSDPTTGPQASTVLKGTTAPTNPAGQTLVRNSLGKGPTDAVDDTGARTAVLAAMMKPLDQGPVGSCFATAPTRRMRETHPLDAMQAFSDLASKGTYKPPFGPEVPAVTNLPAGEDPVMRSWEYTTATSAARRANSSEKTTFAQHVALGTDLLKGPAVKGVAAKDQDAAWTTKKSKLTKDVADAFTFTYDPMSVMTTASDGKSSQGRYVVQQVSNNKEIRSQADFEAAMTEVALASLGIDKAAPEATEVANLVKSPAFISAVCPADYQPWALGGGGQTTAATQTLFGDTLVQKDMLPAVGTPPPTEGDRTKAVLTSFLKNFKGDPSTMVTIRTVGMHGFNALPNDPSLATLKGKDDTETAAKVQTNLVDKGQALKDTDLSADRAVWLFDEAIRTESDGEKDTTLKELIATEAAKFRPTAAMKPAALTAAIDHALDAYHDKAAETQSNTWKGKEEAAGTTIDATALAKKKAEVKKGLADYARNAAKNALMKDMGAPEFVIADSNWGSSRDHTFFVIAPDPTTGEPLLWEKTEPPGSMRPAGREWVDKEWASIQ